VTKIYCWLQSSSAEWLVSASMAEDGTALCSHVSSNIAWAKHDIGIGSEFHHDTYRKFYPDGYELVWVDDPDEHPGLAEAYRKHQLKYPETVQG
jgi:hypothetical protein